MAAKPSSRVTQKMIADAAGVSRVTVTYALKNSPKLPEATCKRIQQIARKLGYMPDPMLSSLAYYRNSQRPAGFHGTLAWLVQESNENPLWWRDSPHYAPYHSGASRRALFYGYKLESYSYNTTTMPLRRTESIMLARSISGILLCPLSRMNSQVELTWEKFSVIALGYTLRSPKLHTVASAHFQNVRHSMAKLQEYGYRRIGLMIPRMTDLRCNSSVSGAYLTAQLSPNDCDPTNIPPLFHIDPVGSPQNADYMDSVLSYVRAYNLDAVLTVDDHLLERIKRIRPQLPPQFGVACISLPQKHSVLSGLVEDSESVGAVAIDMLVAMIQRGERGIPQTPVHSHIEGIWTKGKSLPLALSSSANAQPTSQNAKARSSTKTRIIRAKNKKAGSDATEEANG